MGLPRLRQRRDPDPDLASAETGEEEPLVVEASPPPRRRFLGLRRGQPQEARILWQNGDAISTRLLHVALIAALISGPLALVWVAVTPTQPSTSPAVAMGEATAPQTRDATLAASTAQRLVLTWLTASAGDRAAVQALLVDQLPVRFDLPEKRPAAPAQIWVGEVDQRAPGRYQVVVATVGGTPGAQAYFAVPVRVERGVAAALSLPARTRPPTSPDQDSFRLPALTAVSTDDPAFQTAAGYITAYLTGSSQLDRWTAPGAQLESISPAACRSTRIDNVETAAPENPTTRIGVIATATCQNPGKPPVTTQYGLTLQDRDGRWEVLAEDPALLLNPAVSTAESTASAPPTTSPADPSPSTPR